MALTKEQAIAKATKILTDIEFWGDDVTDPQAVSIQDDLQVQLELANPCWLVTFAYGAEDFGPGNARVQIMLDESTGNLIGGITSRSGVIQIAYDSAHDKYSKK